MSLIWVSADSTVLVTRYEDGSKVYVATRKDSDDVWGPPITCEADAETAKIMAVGRAASQAALAELGMSDS